MRGHRVLPEVSAARRLAAVCGVPDPVWDYRDRARGLSWISGMKYGIALVLGIVSWAQTLPRPAAPFEFTPADGTKVSRLADYKGRIIALYLFSPN